MSLSVKIRLSRPSDVPVPTDFGLSHEDLNLHTPDGIILRSYLLRQRKELDHYQAGRVETDESQTDEEVSRDICLRGRFLICYLVCGHMSNYPDVSREWWKSWTSYTSRKSVLYQHAMQCSYAFISRVSIRVISSNMYWFTCHFRYGHSDGSPSEKGRYLSSKSVELYSPALSRAEVRCTDRS
jgi:hypothetical protein